MTLQKTIPASRAAPKEHSWIAPVLNYRIIAKQRSFSFNAVDTYEQQLNWKLEYSSSCREKSAAMPQR